MSNQELHQTLVQAQLDAEDNEEALRQHHLERLARLFRRVGESEDDRYLLNLMTRYRKVEPS